MTERRGAGRTLRLAGSAVRLVRQADRRLFHAILAVQVLSGVALAAQLLAGRQVLARLLDADRAAAGFADVLPVVALLATAHATASVATQTHAGLSRLLSETTVRHVNACILTVAGRVDLQTFEQPGFYDRLERAQEQGVVAPLRIVGGLASLVAALVGMAGILAAVVAMQPLLVPFVVLGYVPLWRAGAKSSRAGYEFSYGNTPNDRARYHLQDALTDRTAAKEVRAFDLARFLLDRWQRLYDRRLDDVRRLVRAQVRRSTRAAVLASLLLAATLAVLAGLLVTGRLDAASAVAAAIGIQQLGSRLETVGTSAATLYESGLFLDDFTSFTRCEAGEQRTGRAAPERFERLVADGLHYTYPAAAQPALAGVDLEIRAGEVVALVGENGAGKTTLAKLLCGLYAPTSGQIRWDGVDVGEFAAASLRERVAVLFQDFVRYHLSAAENIAVGRPERAGDVAGIVAASRDAGAHDLLAALPRGYQTLLSREFEGGVDLSGGQWQRVALARAFFRDAPFLVLDEPTSALDPRAERDLFESMRTLYAGRAVLLVSHRFSSVRTADRIYVLHEGRVVEHGTHAELMARGGQYAELFTLQSSAYLDETAPDRTATAVERPTELDAAPNGVRSRGAQQPGRAADLRRCERARRDSNPQPFDP